MFVTSFDITLISQVIMHMITSTAHRRMGVLRTPGLSRLKIQVLERAHWCQKTDCTLKTDLCKHVRLLKELGT